MTISALRRAARAAFAFALVSVTLLVNPLAAAAHAELETSNPAEGEVVIGTPEVITADFTETLADGSRLRLRDGAGALVAEGSIDPTDDRRMVIDPPELAAGTYEVVWQALAEDRHLERGRYSFTVEAAAATPAPTPVPSEPTARPTTMRATAVPTSPPPTASSVPAPDEEPATGTSDILLPILAVMALVVIGGAVLLGRRRTTV